MIVRPIIFSGPMVRALLAGKTQTRRLAWEIEPCPTADCPFGGDPDNDRSATCESCPNWHGGPKPSQWRKFHNRFQAGEPAWLYVRETVVIENNYEYRGHSEIPQDRPVLTVDGGFEWGHYELIPHYRATEPEPHIVPEDREDAYDDRTRWTPAIHMPRWASRLSLEVTATKVERLQEISPADAIREGIKTPEGMAARGEEGFKWAFTEAVPSFRELWQQIHGSGSWEANPEVVAITFKVHLANIDEALKAREAA